MTTTQSLDQQGAKIRAAVGEARSARIGLRIAAYLIDTAVLLGFILAFFALAGLVLWISSDLGQEDPPDAAYYGFMGLFIGGTLIGWSVFNLLLLVVRRQSMGQYVVGLRLIPEEGAAIAHRQIVLWWFALHPLLFHPLLVPVWALFSAIAVSLTLNQLVLAMTLGLVALCVVAPIVALAAALLDRDGRALHDRIARTIVAPVNQS